jgi:hypothetical protein
MLLYLSNNQSDLRTTYLRNNGVERRHSTGEQQSGDGYCELNHGGGCYQATSIKNVNVDVVKIFDQKVFSRSDRRL